MAENSGLKSFMRFAEKNIVVHTATYFVFGLVMSRLFHYDRLFQADIIRDFMRPFDSPYIFAGPFLQPIRGLLFAMALWPVRGLLFEGKRGWLILWNLLVMLGILSTPAAAPCSMEGILYTKLPLWYHLIGLPEILLQTLTFSLVLYWWVRRVPQPENARRMSKARAVFLRAMFAVMIACFGYMGYAVGGILIATSQGAKIDLTAAASDIKGQLMFVFAFLVNVICVWILSGKSLLQRYRWWGVFVFFWFADGVAPLLYQAVFMSPMPLLMALALGFFPAVVISVSFHLNRRNFAQLYPV